MADKRLRTAAQRIRKLNAKMDRDPERFRRLAAANARRLFGTSVSTGTNSTTVVPLS